MEMLVVLVLVSMFSVIVLQASSLLFSQYASVSLKLSEIERGTLPNHWFRSSVSALSPGGPEEPIFVGREDFFQGYTFSSVSKLPGELTRIRWLIEKQPTEVALLIVENDGEPLEINRWNAADARFVYFVNADQRVREWKSEDPVLPAGIAFQIEHEDGSVYEVIGSIEGRRVRYLDLEVI